MTKTAAAAFSLILCFFLTSGDLLSSSLTAIFNQDNQTYRWDTSLLYNYNPSSDFTLELSTNTQSTLIKRSLLADGANQWQENRDARARGFYDFSDNFGITAEIFRGYSALGDRNIDDSEILTGADYRPNDWLSFQYLLGAMITSRDEPIGSRIDKGAKMSWKGVLDKQILGADKFNIQLGIEEEIFRAIPSNQFALSSVYQKSFSTGDSLSLQFESLNAKKRYYSSSLEFEETNTQKKREYDFNGKVFKHLFLDLNLITEGDAAFQEYLYETTDTASGFINITNRDNARLSQNVIFKLQRIFRPYSMHIQTSVSYRYNGYDEDFGQDDRDEKSAFGEFGSSVTVLITESDTVASEYFAAVRSFYHPNEFAPNLDRDVVSQLWNLRYSRIWSEYLNSSIQFSYRNYHQVYIYGERSADNNRNYTYLLAPKISWYISPRLIVSQAFEIQANYITYDYERAILSSRNRIFRRGDNRSRITFITGRNLTVNLEYGYRYEDYGQLVYQEQWQQLTSWDRRTHLGFIGFDYYPVSHVRVSPGYSFDYKREWDHSEEIEVIENDTTYTKVRTMVDRQDQRTILLEVEYKFSETEQLLFGISNRIINGWRRGHIRDENFTISLMKFF